MLAARHPALNTKPVFAHALVLEARHPAFNTSRMLANGPFISSPPSAREAPEAFWGEAAESIDWFKKPVTVLDDTEVRARQGPVHRWFVGGELNTCYNAVDRHVEAGRGDVTAIIYDRFA